jgi:hypothetical protein
MGFPPSVKEEALVRSRRCCCVCHEFAGLYTNVHHILPRAAGGPDTIENSIVLCLRCHGEAGHYNRKHPIGNKYSPAELKRHRQEWWQWCKNNPSAPLPNDPISVSPAQIDLGRGNWNAASLLKIYNKSDDPLYQVYVKCRISSPDVPLEAISIEGAPTNKHLDFSLGSIVLSADIYRMSGIDEAGNKALYLWLHYLDPHEVKSFLVRNSTIGSMSESESHFAEIALAAFERNPPRVLQQQERVALPLQLPETFHLNSISLILRRET